jgi:hypothetical protein
MYLIYKSQDRKKFLSGEVYVYGQIYSVNPAVEEASFQFESPKS